ncbi:MAG: excinuclease ABC subunit UvrB [Clostridiales bacterium]|nr:excinuclease ABC subunit UvrB [Clostridiales bacterium]
MDKFRLAARYEPKGDQPEAIAKLCEGLQRGDEHQVLLGVTGSGKTFTMANIVQNLQRPAIVIAHNKTLAAQLCGEFKEYFPDNCVEYFVSYYDYYQPEAYIPSTDTYIEKDSSINDEIDQLRHSATAALLERRDVIIVASVSCIYGLGDPKDYENLMVSVRKGMKRERDDVISALVDIQYTRNEIDFKRGTFRAKGDVLEIIPANYDKIGYRIEFFGDEIERIMEIDIVTGEIKGVRNHVAIFPASHFATTQDKMIKAVSGISEELEWRLNELRENNKLVEAQRLEQRTRYDIEMLTNVGMCSGIENYSRHISGRAEGSPPYTLLDYFPDDYIMFIDEAHATRPQIGAMYKGDKARKKSLIDFGFRLPSAYDNRPLMFEEFKERQNQTIYVSATPADYEKELSTQIVEQIIRPTGLIDPDISIKPIKGQVEDLIGEIRITVAKGFRVLVTTLTKRMSENLTEYIENLDIRVRYLHSDIDTLERMEILRDLRLGEFDVLVGINLLREGLDLPEVALVAILDADREGFLRSSRSLIQTVGRAARNVEGRVIMYADRITKSMKETIDETNRRRKIQIAYNEKNNITPKTIIKKVRGVMETVVKDDEVRYGRGPKKIKNIKSEITRLSMLMEKSAAHLEFEAAARYRDEIKKLRKFKDGGEL